MYKLLPFELVVHFKIPNKFDKTYFDNCKLQILKYKCTIACSLCLNPYVSILYTQLCSEIPIDDGWQGFMENYVLNKHHGSMSMVEDSGASREDSA